MSSYLVRAEGGIIVDPETDQRATWLAVREGRVIGHDRGAIAAAGPHAHELRFPGTLCPAPQDAHEHPALFSPALDHLDLGSCADQHEVAQRIEDAPIKGIIGQAYNWDPTRHPLERGLLPDQPWLLRDRSEHGGWLTPAGARALAAAGLRVEPGRLEEPPLALCRNFLAPGVEATAELIERYQKRLLGLGVSAVQDLVLLGATHWDAYLQLESRGRLPLATEAWVYQPAWSQLPDELKGRRGRFSVSGVKFFLDGSMASRSAALSRTACCPEWPAPTDFDLLRAQAEAVLEDGAPALALHCIGDRAVVRALELAEALPSARIRLEHAEICPPELIERIARRGLPVVVQSGFSADRDLYRDRLASWQRDALNPFRGFLDAGVLVALTSDGMPSGIGPARRSAVDAPAAWQQLSPAEALRAHTVAAAAVAAGPGAGADLASLGRLGLGAVASLSHSQQDPMREPALDLELVMHEGRPRDLS